MQIINWLQVFHSHLCKWLLLPFITASFSTCPSISSSWWCQNNISRSCCLQNAKAQMKAQRRSLHNRNVASQAWCCPLGCTMFTVFQHFWKKLWKVHNIKHCFCAVWIAAVSKKSKTGTNFKFFTYLLSYLQVHKVKWMAGSLEIRDY